MSKTINQIDSESLLAYAFSPDYRTSGVVVNRHKDARFKIHTDDKLLTIIIVEPRENSAVNI